VQQQFGEAKGFADALISFIMAGSSLLIGYLYLIQGIVLSLPAVLPLTYKELPGYSVLSLFSAAWLPFSFKFVSGTRG